ncbi:MAG: putative toxin-antitoxin system toxin component, PIN family [Acidithiobacillus sp.]
MQLDEIRRASRYPKFQTVLQPAQVGTMVNNLQRAVILEHLTNEVEADDPDDAFLLAMALAGDADYLVTGDRRAGLLQRGHIQRTRIVTPAVFCAEMLR